jgi:hypothetical protein
MVREWYSHLDDVCIVTPPGGGGDIEYYTGSYLWQAAIVEYLLERPETSGSTVVTGDDLLLRPEVALDDLLGPNPEETVCHPGIWPVTGRLMRDWYWVPRIALTWHYPMNPLFGNGTLNNHETLLGSEIYLRNRDTIDQLPKTRLGVEIDAATSELWLDRAAAQLTPQGHVDYGLGVPIYAGYSDFFTFPNSYSSDFVDFLRRSVRANMFVETAIPTMLQWSELSIVEVADRLEVLWEADREQLNFTSLDQVDAYFDSHPHVVGAHPIKLSKLFTDPEVTQR